MPGQPDVVALELPDVAHPFGCGHRLLAQIQRPRQSPIDRNPPALLDVTMDRPRDFQQATMGDCRLVAWFVFPDIFKGRCRDDGNRLLTPGP